MAPEDYVGDTLAGDWKGTISCHAQASLEVTFAGLKPAVATGGIDCETVVEAL